VEATIQQVAEHGWDRVTTRSIGRAAGANQALINYHFGSKEGLMRAALELALRHAFAEPLEAMLAAPSFADGAVALLDGLADMDMAEPHNRFTMEALARAPREGELRGVMAELLAELRAVLASGIVEAQGRGEVPPSVDPIGTATLLGAVFDGLGLHLLIDPSLDIAPAVAAVRGMLTRT